MSETLDAAKAETQHAAIDTDLAELLITGNDSDFVIITKKDGIKFKAHTKVLRNHGDYWRVVAGRCFLEATTGEVVLDTSADLMASCFGSCTPVRTHAQLWRNQMLFGMLRS
jgi:hypothetical protein